MEVFYPGKTPVQVDQTSQRRPGFLVGLDDGSFWDVYGRIARRPDMRFPDIHCLTRLSSDDGRILPQVMEHVVDWLGNDRTPSGNKRDNNKPPRRKDLIPALGHFDQKLIRRAKRRVDLFASGQSEEQSPAEVASILMQQEILEFVHRRLVGFKSASIKKDLAQRLEADDVENYGLRFLKAEWSSVLGIVRDYTEPEFRPEWATSTQSQPGEGRDAEGAARELADALLRFTASKVEEIDHAAVRRQVCDPSFQDRLKRWLLQQCGHKPQVDGGREPTNSQHMSEMEDDAVTGLEHISSGHLASEDELDDRPRATASSETDVLHGERLLREEAATIRDATLTTPVAAGGTRGYRAVRRQSLPSSRMELPPSSPPDAPPSGQEAALLSTSTPVPRSSIASKLPSRKSVPLTPRTPSAQRISVQNLILPSSRNHITKPSQGPWRKGNKATTTA